MRSSLSWCFPPAIVTGLLILALVSRGHAQSPSREEATMQAAGTVLDEVMAIPAKGIPRSMMETAEGVAIIPNVIKGGFIIGAGYGTGVLVIKEKGYWRAPVFIRLTGGNLGWQAGVQATDVVLVFKSQRSIQGILSGTFTLGVDAAAAAGPVGREASAATDASLRSEIYSYSRSRGIFAGVSFDGSALTIDQFANAAYYQQGAAAGSGSVPPSARARAEDRRLQQAASRCRGSAGTDQSTLSSDKRRGGNSAPSIGADRSGIVRDGATGMANVSGNARRGLQRPEGAGSGCVESGAGAILDRRHRSSFSIAGGTAQVPINLRTPAALRTSAAAAARRRHAAATAHGAGRRELLGGGYSTLAGSSVSTSGAASSSSSAGSVTSSSSSVAASASSASISSTSASASASASSAS